ncbi:MgtC/SapB family protein [Pseudidiomarina halophila]|uniref:MgtC/SapB family protein n=1 Tax=Pseudidiomarina halophila TaxID=1449799 RepID=UPI00360B14C7
MITGISFVGYFSIKLLGSHRGLLLTGLLGGIASSTAVTLSMAQLGRAQTVGHRLLVATLLIAAGTMFPRMLIEVAVVNRELLTHVTGPLLSMMVVSLIGVGWLVLRGTRDGQPTAVTVKNPFDIITALKFAALLVIILLVAHYAHQYFDANGIYAVAAISGLSDVDAITLSMAKMAKTDTVAGGISADVATYAIVLAASVNTLVKAGLVISLGHRSMWRPTLLVCSAAVLVGWFTLFLLS